MVKNTPECKGVQNKDIAMWNLDRLTVWGKQTEYI